MKRGERDAAKVVAIKEAWRKGVTSGLLADELGITRSAVMGVYNRNKAALAACPLGGRLGRPRNRSAVPARWTQDKVDQVAEHRKAGMSFLEIAKRMGMTEGMISGIFERRRELRAINPGRAPVRFGKPRGARPKQPFKPVVITNTKMLVEDWIAQGKIRRFDSGESTDYYAIVAYLRERGYILSQAHQKYTLSSGRGRPRRVGWNDVLAVVDRFRIAEGKPPILRRAA